MMLLSRIRDRATAVTVHIPGEVGRRFRNEVGH